MKHYNIVKKAISAGLIVTLGTTILTGCSESDKKSDNDTLKPGTEKIEVADGTGFGYKDETVYVTTDGDGKVTDITVSEWLKNMENVGMLKDATNLKDIANVKGYEEFAVADGVVTFKTDGSDIYYQGKTDSDAKLPIGLTITYTLDGNKITAEELKGKSGHLVMTIKYDAIQKKTATIKGEEKDVYVPFLAVTGMLLPTDKFDNIKIDNGTIISNGNYVIAAGYGMPGFAENFEVEDASTVTVEADVKEYEISMMMTMVTNSLYKDVDTTALDDSVTKFLSRFGELTDGVAKLDEGATALSVGAAQLKDGVSKINIGIKTVKKNIVTLNQGMSHAYTGMATLDSKVNELKAGAEKLQAGAAQLDGGVDKLVAEMNKLSATINETVTQYGTLIAQSRTQIQQLEGAIVAGYPGYATQENLNKLAQFHQAEGAYAALSQIKAQLDAKDANGKTVAENLQLLAAGSEELKNGSATLTEGAKQLYISGTNALVSAMKQLSEGCAALDTGMNELVVGGDDLEEGAVKLNDGAAELAAGINTIASKIPEAVEKIKESMSGDPEKMMAYLNEMVKASNEYKSFSDMDDTQNGEVKFIIKTK